MMTAYKTLRNGEQIIVHAMPPIEKVAEQFDVVGDVVYVRYTYHYHNRNVVLCWSQTNFAFLPSWPFNAYCRCQLRDDTADALRKKTQLAAACAVFAMQEHGDWGPCVLLLPYEAVCELASALTAGAVVVTRADNKHNYTKFERQYSVPAKSYDPIRLLMGFAHSRFTYSQSVFPPVTGRFACTSVVQKQVQLKQNGQPSGPILLDRAVSEHQSKLMDALIARGYSREEAERILKLKG
jgi:hypothetical protein